MIVHAYKFTLISKYHNLAREQLYFSSTKLKMFGQIALPITKSKIVYSNDTKASGDMTSKLKRLTGNFKSTMREKQVKWRANNKSIEVEVQKNK